MIPPRAGSVEAMLAVCTPKVRRLIEALRKLVLGVVPHATERFRPGWGLIGYNAPSYFAFIVAEPDVVRLGFEWGVLLSDPDGVLEGSGTQVRYATVRTLGDVRAPWLGALLYEAAALSPPRRTRNRRSPR